GEGRHPEPRVIAQQREGALADHAGGTQHDHGDARARGHGDLLVDGRAIIARRSPAGSACTRPARPCTPPAPPFTHPASRVTASRAYPERPEWGSRPPRTPYGGRDHSRADGERAPRPARGIELLLDPLAERLARLEVRVVLLRDLDLAAGRRVGAG